MGYNLTVPMAMASGFMPNLTAEQVWNSAYEDVVRAITYKMAMRE